MERGKGDSPRSRKRKKERASTHIPPRRFNNFARGCQPRLRFADAILPQSPHAHFARTGAQDRRRHFFINQLPRFIIYHENFKDAKAPTVTSIRAVVASFASHKGGSLEGGRVQTQSAQLCVRRRKERGALLADFSHD